MITKKSAIISEVQKVVEPILEDLGFELVAIDYLSSRGGWILRIYIDRDGGVTLDDCALASREIGDVLDIHEVLNHGYVLELSSPGLDRPLTREKDFLKAVGKRLKVKTINPIHGSRNFKGYLRTVADGNLEIETEKGIVSFALGEVEKANLIYEINDI
ncbi:MAG: ribosome maturation factor RimP [Desulfobacteraceae bacterium]|nr:MAG: ribosome maturation factor RimP [Desulfobacteraceae bacterium]